MIPYHFPPSIKTSLALSISPFIFTTPLLVYQSQHLSLTSLISNLLILDIIEFIVVIGFFSSIIGFISYSLSLFGHTTAEGALMIIEIVITWLDKIPQGSQYVSKPSLITTIFIYIVIFTFCFTKRKKPFKKKPLDNQHHCLFHLLNRN